MTCEAHAETSSRNGNETTTVKSRAMQSISQEYGAIPGHFRQSVRILYLPAREEPAFSPYGEIMSELMRPWHARRILIPCPLVRESVGLPGDQVLMPDGWRVIPSWVVGARGSGLSELLEAPAPYEHSTHDHRRVQTLWRHLRT